MPPRTRRAPPVTPEQPDDGSELQSPSPFAPDTSEPGLVPDDALKGMDPPSKQLIRESRLSSTPLQQPAVHGTPRSTKSVRFSDIPGLDVATESAGLLASARSKRTQAPFPKTETGKLKRPTRTTEGPRERKIDDPTLAGSPQITQSTGFERAHTHRDIYDLELEEESRSVSRNSELQHNHIEHPDVASPPATRQSSTRKARSEGNAAASDGASSRTSLNTVGTQRGARGGNLWSLEDRQKLLALRELQCPWETVQKYFPERTLQALQTRASADKKNAEYRPSKEIVAKCERLLAASKKRKATPEAAVDEQEQSSSKRRRVETGRPVSSPRGSTPSKQPTAQMQPQTQRNRAQARAVGPEKVAADKDGHRLEATEEEPSVTVQAQPTSRLRQHARSPRVVVTDGRISTHDYEYVPAPPPGPQAEIGIQEDEEPESIVIASDGPDPFFGQTEKLNAVFEVIKRYQNAEERKEFYTPEYRQKNILEPISELCDTCHKCEDALNGMREAQGDAEGILQLKMHSVLGEMRQLLSDIDPDRNADKKTAYATQVYLYVFPALVAVLKAAIDYLTVQHHNDSHLGKVYLDFLIKIISMIVDLGNQAAKWKTKPVVKQKGDVAFVKPIAHGVVVPLKRIRTALRREYNDLIALEEQGRAAAERQRKRQLWVERQRREALRQEREDDLRRRLSTLYLWRKWAEPNRRLWIVHDMPPRLSLKHQRVEPQLEVDANGREFERMPLFRPREHPPHNPDHEEWTDPELEALLMALFYNHGRSNLWLHVFSECCGHDRGIDGPLRHREVGEILRMTKRMQDWMVETARKENREPDPEVLQIPDLDLLEVL